MYKLVNCSLEWGHNWAQSFSWRPFQCSWVFSLVLFSQKPVFFFWMENNPSKDFHENFFFIWTEESTFNFFPWTEVWSGKANFVPMNNQVFQELFFENWKIFWRTQSSRKFSKTYQSSERCSEFWLILCFFLVLRHVYNFANNYF